MVMTKIPNQPNGYVSPPATRSKENEKRDDANKPVHWKEHERVRTSTQEWPIRLKE